MSETITAETPSKDTFDRNEDGVTAHYSSLQLHRRCPQAFYYRYSLGLGTVPTDDPAPYLHFGRWWGALRAAESLERGRQIGSLMGSPKPFKAEDSMAKFDANTVTVAEILEAAEWWWKQAPESTREEFLAKLGKELKPHLEYTLTQWRDMWSDEIKYERPLGVEVFWKRELPRPAGDRVWDGDTTDMPRMLLLGYIDELYEDTQRGMVVVRDHKSTSWMGLQTVVDDMMDSQLQLYPWGIAPKLAELGLPTARAVAYDRAKSIAPKPPTITTAGKLASRGGEPSINGSDLRTYLDWAAGPDGDGLEYLGRKPAGGTATIGGKYTAEPDIIERLANPSARSAWFQRKLVPISQNLVRAHLRAAVDTATDIWRTERRGELAHEANRNLSRDNCKYCDYVALCRAQMMGGPDGVYDLAEYGLRSGKGAQLEAGHIV